jgi:hypothetical protein
MEVDVEASTSFGTTFENVDPDSERPRRKRKSDIGGNGDSENGELKQRKRRKNCKAGKLWLLMDMPMDVLFEVRSYSGSLPLLTRLKFKQIFSHLLPLDILYLARTTKEFRDVLMHRSSISLWKAARANVPGFPECPPYLTVRIRIQSPP